jgi:MFS family permease
MFFIIVGEATNVLEVFLARDELGATETQYGLLSAAFGLGMAAGAAMAGRIRTPRVRLRVLLASMTGASAFLVLTGMVPSVELLFAAYTGTGMACGVLNACFGAIAILRIPESGRGQAMAIVGGMTRAVSIGALALGGLLGVLVPVRASFIFTGAAGALVALALTAYVLPRFGREDSASGSGSGSGDPAAAEAALPAGAGATVSGRQQEAVANQVPDFLEQASAELRAVKPLVAAQQRLEGADDLPDGQIAVAR